jgi:ankyrin repeat protein
MLVAAGADAQQAKSTGETPFFAACEKGHVDVTKLMLRVRGVNVNRPKSNGETPLYVACERGHLDIVRLLLRAKGIQINQARDNGVGNFSRPDIILLTTLLQSITFGSIICPILVILFTDI